MPTKPPDAKVPILDMVVGTLINEVLFNLRGFSQFSFLKKPKGLAD